MLVILALFDNNKRKKTFKDEESPKFCELKCEVEALPHILWEPT